MYGSDAEGDAVWSDLEFDDSDSEDHDGEDEDDNGNYRADADGLMLGQLNDSDEERDDAGGWETTEDEAEADDETESVDGDKSGEEGGRAE